MKYPYIVNLNGKWYEAGTDVPASSISEKVEEKENTITKEVAKYSKTDIQRMSTDQLRALAVTEGIENAEETSGNQLKKKLVEHFEL